jgi:outer membrane protein, heavy metal efflux system
MIYLRISMVVAFLVFTAYALPGDTSSTAASNERRFQETLRTLIVAAKNNPGLKAADAKAQSTAVSASGKKSLDPPLVAVDFYQAPVKSFPNPFKEQMEYDYSLQQMIPFPGKLGAMADAQRKRTEMLRADRQTLEQIIVRNVKTIFYDVYLKYRQMEINHETRALVRGFVDIAAKQYEVGMGKQSDVLRAQTELSSLANDSIVLIQQRKSMEGMINALCARPVNTEIGVIPEIVPAIPDYDLNALLILSEKNRPELKSMFSNIEMQQAEHAAARKEYMPDFMVRGTYKQMVERPDAWSVMIGATVPIAPWSSAKYASGTASADANINAARSEFLNMKNMIASEVNDALLKIRSSMERLKLSKETAIPQAQQTLESALAAYWAGKQEFLMVLDIQRMLVMAKLDYHMAVMALMDSQSQLERAVGLNSDEIDKSFERGNK